MTSLNETYPRSRTHTYVALGGFIAAMTAFAVLFLQVRQLDHVYGDLARNSDSIETNIKTQGERRDQLTLAVSGLEARQLDLQSKLSDLEAKNQQREDLLKSVADLESRKSVAEKMLTDAKDLDRQISEANVVLDKAQRDGIAAVQDAKRAEQELEDKTKDLESKQLELDRLQKGIADLKSTTTSLIPPYSPNSASLVACAGKRCRFKLLDRSRRQHRTHAWVKLYSRSRPVSIVRFASGAGPIG